MEEIKLSLKIEDLRALIIGAGIVQISVLLLMAAILKSSIDSNKTKEDVKIHNHITINNDEYIDEDEEEPTEI